MRRLLYLLREALANVLTNRTTTVVAVATTAFTFACVGVFLLLYVNLRAMALSLEQDIQVMVYLQDDVTGQVKSEIEQQLKADRAVAALTFVSKEQALADFQAQFPAESHLLQGLGQNPLAGVIRRDAGGGVPFVGCNATLGRPCPADYGGWTGPV